MPSSLAEYGTVSVSADIRAKDLEGSDYCEVQVSFDGFATFHSLVTVADPEDDTSVISGSDSFDIGSDVAKGDSVQVRFLSSTDDTTDKCFLRALTITGDPFTLYERDFQVDTSVGAWDYSGTYGGTSPEWVSTGKCLALAL